jgi:lysyl-tRNA synthetase class 1
MLLDMPTKSGDHVPYNLLTFLAKVAPEDSEVDFVMEKLRGYGYGKEGLTDDLKQRIGYALNWSKDFTEIKEKAVELNEQEKGAVKELIQALQKETDEEQIQGEFFNIARNSGIKPGKFFKTVYRILLGVPQGPRLGPYILAMGKENVIEALRRVTES